MTESVILAVGAALLGAILGSFINALSFRFNTGRSMGGRSRCMHCGHRLESGDLVPVLSFIALRGKCRYCRARISLQYPLVEAAAALLALLVFLEHAPAGQGGAGILSFFLWLSVWMTLLFTVVYDLRHKIIPHSCSVALIMLSIALLVLEGRTDIASLAAGPSLAAPLLLISLLSGGRAMGWGDGILQLSLGWLLGFTAGLTALFMAFWSGALVGIALLVGQKGRTIGSEGAPYARRSLGSERRRSFRSLHLSMKSEIPFAPFLALGALVAHFFHVDIFSTIHLFW